MTKTIKLALVAAIAMGGTSAFATNGDNLISTGTQSRAMGGVGIAKSFGAESGLSNPALLSSVKNSEVAGSLTFFMPDVAAGSNVQSNAGAALQGAVGMTVPITSANSDADFSIIPEIAFASRINDNLVYGFSLTGTAGMGVDYSSTTFTPTDPGNGVFQMKTELALLKVAIPFAYQMDGLSLGVSPILQYGTLQMSHQTFTGPLASPKSSDTSFGYEVGASYDFNAVGVDGLTIGAVYKSELAMTYDNTISGSLLAFGMAPGFTQPGVTPITSGDNLDQPAEMGIGISYAMGQSTIALDYRNVAWGEAAGYSDFGWEDQDIISVGYEYATSTWAVRVGYNYAESPIKEQDGNTYGGAVKNFFNLAGFPGIVESHFTLGGGYAIDKKLTLDAAVVYAAEVSESFNTNGLAAAAYAFGGGTSPQNVGASSIDVTHSQLGITLGLNYKF